MKKLIGLFVFLAILGFSVPAVSHADTISDLQSQIKALLEQVKILQVKLAQAQGQSNGQFCHNFDENLKIGDRSEEVGALVNILVKEGVMAERSSNFSKDFDEETASAVSTLQQKYEGEILRPAGLRSGTGYLGSHTRAKLNRLYGCGTTIHPNDSSVVINGVGGPHSLRVGEQGTWTVKASSSNGGNLSYSVVWGDESYRDMPQSSSHGMMVAYQQSATFTHTYSQAGNYKPTFIVESENTIRCITTPCPSNGGSAKTSLSVNVGGGIVIDPIACPRYEHTNPPVPVPVSVEQAVSVNGSSTSVSGTASSVTNSSTLMPPAYRAAPCITYLSPASGHVDTTVIIYGNNFSSNNNSITFAGTRVATGVASPDGTMIKFSIPSAVSDYIPCMSNIPPCLPPVSARLIIPGTYEISVNNGGSESNSVKFTVTGGIIETQPALKVVSPNGGEVWTKGTKQTISWQDYTPRPLMPCGVGFDCSSYPSKYDITLSPYYPPCTGQVCPAYAYQAPYIVAKNVSNGSYVWSVGDIMKSLGTTSVGGGEDYTKGVAIDGTYTIQVCQSGTSVCDSSDSHFQIMSGPTL